MKSPGRKIPADIENPLLVITVDTEEDGLWSGDYARDGHTTQNLDSLPVLVRLLTEYSLKGTYLVSYPVVDDARSRDIVSEAISDNRGEVGTHLHSWCCPPYAPDEDRLPPYPHCLPPELQLQKLKVLSESIERGFGEKPISYRAGRWGFDSSSLGPLVESGHLVDSSVVPGWWQRGAGAPAFARAPVVPYRLDGAEILRPGNSPVVEIPVTTGMIGHIPGREAITRAIPYWLPGSRTASNLFGYTILRPALHDVPRLTRLVDRVLREKRPVLNVMLHSSEIAPGHSPYSRDEGQRDELLARLRAVIETALHGNSCAPATLREVRDALFPENLSPPLPTS